MVSETIASRGVEDARVLAARRKVPRHEFLPPAVRSQAYDDVPVPIGYGQTASQPYIVAVMTELAELGPHARVRSGPGAATRPPSEKAFEGREVRADARRIA
jgi:protein-L-isoaspartate(D-aspartate) O-methyltransferase